MGSLIEGLMFMKRVITSLVYEICEFFAKRYLRKGIAKVKNASRVIKEWDAYINNTKNKLRYLIDLTLTRDIARKYSIA